MILTISDPSTVPVTRTLSPRTAIWKRSSGEYTSNAR